MRCKWYSVCPMRRHEQAGRIDNSWRDKYCLGDCRTCIRYQKEEAGVPHSDELLPDGTYLGDEGGIGTDISL